MPIIAAPPATSASVGPSAVHRYVAKANTVVASIYYYLSADPEGHPPDFDMGRPLAQIISFKVVCSRPLTSMKHFSSASRSFERVSLIQWHYYPFLFFVEALGLFTSDFLAAESCELMVCSLGRFRKSGVLITTVCGTFWQPPSLTLITLWARATFTSLLRAFPSWCSNDSTQPSVYSVSLLSYFNSCNTSAIPSLIARNIPSELALR